METKYSKTLWQILRILWQERQKTLNSKGLLGSWGSGGRDSNPSRLRRDDRPKFLYMDVTILGNTSVYQCRPHLKGSNYFMISHHGSLNGHLRNLCPASMRITNLSNCLPKTATPVLMGRDGAYNGIYSRQVLNDFPRLIFSEKNPQSQKAKFRQIDWQTNQYTWL